MRGARLAAVSALLASSFVASAAYAEPPPSGPQEDHRTALYREGFDAATAGRWAEARERFAAALAIRTSPKVLFSLAQAEDQLGQLASAARDYAQAVKGASAAGENEVVAAGQKALTAITPRVPTVRIVVRGDIGATATLDDRPVALGTLVAVDPGSHRVVVRAPGMSDAQAALAISEHQQLDVPLRMQPVSAGPPPPVMTVAEPPASVRRSGGGPWPTVGLATAGAGVVLAGLGAYFGVVAKNKNDQSYGAGCNDADQCSPVAASVRRDAISAGNASTGLFIAGGVLVAGGVTLWLVAPSSHGDGGVAVTPVALTSGGGVSVTGGW